MAGCAGGGRVEIELPGLADEVFAEAVVALFVDEVEAGLLIDVAGGMEIALRPEGDSAVAGLFGEDDALVDQRCAEAGSAGGGFDQQQAELGDGGTDGVLDEEDVAYGLGFGFSDPTAVAGGVEVGEEAGGDVSDEELEVGVVAIFLCIDCALAMDNPADVAGPMGAERNVFGVHGQWWRILGQKAKSERKPRSRALSLRAVS